MEEKEERREVPDVRDPKTPDVRSCAGRRCLPRQRNIADAFTDAVLTFAYFGKLHTRKDDRERNLDGDDDFYQYYS